jgi:EmrB/QacA subfamily drug resistance transporter
MTTNSVPDTASPGATGEYTHRQILTILSGLMLGMFLGALDQTIVSTSIRTIADDLQGLSLQAWVTTGYLITATITTPIYGKLGDLYGRKKLFLFAITLFVAGSALCAFADSMYQLAMFRAVQGLGAGGLFTLVLAIIGDIVSPRERAKYSGYFMAMFGTASVLGPLIGGFFAGQDTLLGVAGWRWVFLVNVPLGALAIAVVIRTLHVHNAPRAGRVRIDWWGAVALFAGLIPLLLVLEQGRDWGWGSGRSIALFVISAVGLFAFWLVERGMGDAALIPLRLFRVRAVTVSVTGSMLVGVAMFGGIMLLPLYMQIAKGASPTQAGILMLPMVLGMMIASITAGRLIGRTGITRPFPIVGSALVSIGLLLLSFTGADTSQGWISASMFVLGIGLGNCLQPLLLIMQSAVPPTEIGVATSSATFFRQIGGTIGVAIFLTVLFGGLGQNIATATATESQTPAYQQAVAAGGAADAGIIRDFQDDSTVIEDLDPVIAHPFKVGFADSMSTVFLMASGVAGVAFFVLLLMPNVELRSTSAHAAARATAAAPTRTPQTDSAGQDE